MRTRARNILVPRIALWSVAVAGLHYRVNGRNVQQRAVTRALRAALAEYESGESTLSDQSATITIAIRVPADGWKDDAVKEIHEFMESNGSYELAVGAKPGLFEYVITTSGFEDDASALPDDERLAQTKGFVCGALAALTDGNVSEARTQLSDALQKLSDVIC